MRKYLKPKTEYRMQIGQHIRMWRDLKGIKQDELSRMLGITPPALSHIENNITELTLHRLEDIADALGLKPEQLFTGPDKSFNLTTKNSESNSVDKELLNRILVLMENMNNHFSGKK